MRCSCRARAGLARRVGLGTFIALLALPFSAKAFIGEASVAFTADDAPWGLDAEDWNSGAAGRWGPGGLAEAAGAANATRLPLVWQWWQDERGAAPAGPSASRGGARRGGRQQQEPPPPQRRKNDGGGAYTCVPFTPGVDALPANATLVRRFALKEPLPLPGFASLAAPTPDDVAAFIAHKFDVAPGTLRPVDGAEPADRTDELGMRHVKLEQVQPWLEDLYGVEFGAVSVHLRAGANGAPEVYLVTGGYIDDVGARLAAGARKGGPPDGRNGERPLVDAETAAMIGVEAAFSGATGGVSGGLGGWNAAKERARAGSLLEGTRRRRAAGQRAPASDAADVEAAAEEGRTEPAGARGGAARVVYCEADGSCHAAWRQAVYVPAGYRAGGGSSSGSGSGSGSGASKDPQELHVYVSAADGRVLAAHDRLRTWSGASRRAARRYAASAEPEPQQQQQQQQPDDQQQQTPTGAVEPPALLPSSAYATPRDSSPEALLAAEAINSRLRARYDGPALEPAIGLGQTLYSGPVPLSTARVTRLTRRGDKAPAGFVMTDLRRSGIRTYDLGGRDGDARGGAPGELVSDRRSNQWGDGSPSDRQTAAADAHWGMGLVYDYYLQRHNRSGVDGHGTPFFARTHMGRKMNDAYWSANHVTLGDGSRDPRKPFESCEGLPPLVTLDILGHEISHGVIEATGRMAYAYSFGGLNEATADILSVCVQDHAHTTGAARRPLSWFPGEQMFSASCERPWIRSMPNPADDGRSWSCWHPSFDATWVSRSMGPSPVAPPPQFSQRGDGRRGRRGGPSSNGAAPDGAADGAGGGAEYCYVDVHWSSGPANRAFYLMAEGLGCGDKAGARPLGVRRACDVWYRALTSYFTPVTDYSEARAATARAAADLYPGDPAAAAAVHAAWDVVGAPLGPAGPGAPRPPRCDADFATDYAKCSAAAGRR